MSNPVDQIGRRALLGLAPAAAAVFWPLPGWPRPASDLVSAAGLAQLFTRPDSAIVIGRRYLSREPGEGPPRALASDLQRASAGDPAAARTDLRDRVRRDFERGDTVLLDGWVLARSECHACAAVALAAGAAAPGRAR